MADAPAAAEPAAADAAPKKRPAWLALVKAMAFLSVVVVIEVAAAGMLIPSADQTRRIAQQLADPGKGKDAAAGESGAKSGEESAEGAAQESQPTHEVNLGTYHIVSFNPKANKSLSVDFELFGAVLATEEPEFTELFTSREKRISEQVTMAVRGMEVGDFADPGLGLIKRIIFEKVNRALGKPLVREVIVSQFSFIER